MTAVNDPAPNRFANTVTLWSACFVPMMPAQPDGMSEDHARRACKEGHGSPAVVNATSAPVLVPALFVATSRK